MMLLNAVEIKATFLTTASYYVRLLA